MGGAEAPSDGRFRRGFDLAAAGDDDGLRVARWGHLGYVDGVEGKAEVSLSKARKAEMEASHAYEMLKQSIEMELSTMQKRMAAATNERSSTEETMHAATEELDETKKSKAADEAYLADLKMDCAAKSKEWEERQKSVAEELADRERRGGRLSEDS